VVTLSIPRVLIFVRRVLEFHFGLHFGGIHRATCRDSAEEKPSHAPTAGI